MNRDIVITMDMDWVPDRVIEYSLELLASYNIRTTLFMTNYTKVNVSGHEIGIHPNFTSLKLGKHIKNCLDKFPDAKGIRSHSLFYTERLRPIYAYYGIEYQSNYMMYRKSGIQPLWISPTTIELPIYWMDNFYMEMEPLVNFSIEGLELDKEGLKVFCFHPIHIFLNTERLSRYEEAKKCYKSTKDLFEMCNTKNRGIKDIFLELLNYIKTEHIPGKVLSDIREGFCK
ncbi:MAG: hypothetical protein KKF54_03005 [Candidatus Omnitrophica bacterium]|nr:hypothetical protein [Candidatus Omnitrophota bacterium]